MRIINYPELIKESATRLRELYKNISSFKLRNRCEILLWLKTGEVRSMKVAVALKGMSVSQGNNLWNQYKKEGIDGYLRLKYKPQRSPLADKEELGKRLSEEGFPTIKEAQEWILEKYNIKYTENGLGNYFRNKKIKLKTGRPHHPEQDEAKRTAYKKNMKKN